MREIVASAPLGFALTVASAQAAEHERPDASARRAVVGTGKERLGEGERRAARG